MVFVVDDEPMIADMLGNFLGMEGLEVSVFHHPNDAWLAFELANPKPQVLIADHRMPGMSGLELFKLCKQLHPAIKTISISGTMNNEDMELAGLMPDRIVRKPFRPSELLPPIWELLGCTQPIPTSLDLHSRLLRHQLLLACSTGTLVQMMGN